MQIDGTEVSGTEEVRHVACITPFHTEVLGDTTPSGALLDILRNTMPRHRGLTIQRTILPRTPPSAISQLHQTQAQQGTGDKGLTAFQGDIARRVCWE